jgi:hypothetical protein
MLVQREPNYGLTPFPSWQPFAEAAPMSLLAAPRPTRKQSLYRIFYDVSEELRTVSILHVWHGAREEPKF